MDCLFVFVSNWWNQHPFRVWKRLSNSLESTSSNVIFAREGMSLVCFWSGDRRHGAQRIESSFKSIVQNIVIPLTRYANCNGYLIDCLSLIFHYYMVKTINAFLGFDSFGTTRSWSFFKTLEYPWELNPFSADTWEHHDAKLCKSLREVTTTYFEVII